MGQNALGQSDCRIFKLTLSPEHKDIQSLGIFRTLAYSEPWRVQNKGHVQNSAIFRTVAYSEPWGVL